MPRALDKSEEAEVDNKMGIYLKLVGCVHVVPT